MYFLYEILVYSKTKEEHILHLTLVLETLVEDTLFAKRSKCKFGCKEIEYLGHLVSTEVVKANPYKIQSMVDWPQPKSLKSLRGPGPHGVLQKMYSVL